MILKWQKENSDNSSISILPSSIINMKILHVAPNFYPVTGGVETFVYESSKRLAKKGYDVHVITNNKIPFKKTVLPKQEIVDGIKVTRVPFRNLLRYSLPAKALRLILRSDYDFLHIHSIGFLTDLIPLIKLRSGKVVLHTHGGIFHTDYWKPLKKFYFNSMCRLTFSFLDKIIAHSKNDLKMFSSVCPEKKIELIPYGIDWENLSETKKESDGKTIIYVGRFSDNKKIDRQIHVLSHLKKEIPDIKLILVGGDWGEKQNIIELAARLNVIKNIEFVGSVPHKNVAKYLSKADLFFLSSDYEGLGMSVLEAMAVGLPTIANNIDSMKSIVQNRKNGFLVDFDNHKNVSSTVLKLLKDRKLRTKMSKHAKASVKEYDWGNIIKKIENFYNTC